MTVMIEIQVVSQRTSGQNLALRNSVTSQNYCQFFQDFISLWNSKAPTTADCCRTDQNQFWNRIGKNSFFKYLGGLSHQFEWNAAIVNINDVQCTKKY